MLSLFPVSLWKVITGEAGRDAKKAWETSRSYEFVSSPIYQWDSGEGTQRGCFEKLNNRKDMGRIETEHQNWVINPEILIIVFTY